MKAIHTCVLTTLVFGECNSSCLSSKSRFGNDREHWAHPYDPSDLLHGLSDRPLSSLMCAEMDVATDDNDDADGRRGCCCDWWCKWFWWCILDNGDTAPIEWFNRSSCNSSLFNGWHVSMCSLRAWQNREKYNFNVASSLIYKRASASFMYLKVWQALAALWTIDEIVWMWILILFQSWHQWWNCK